MTLIATYCDYCGKIVGVLSERQAGRLTGSDLYARAVSLQREHSAISACAAGLDTKLIWLPAAEAPPASQEVE